MQLLSPTPKNKKFMLFIILFLLFIYSLLNVEHDYWFIGTIVGAIGMLMVCTIAFDHPYEVKRVDYERPIFSLKVENKIQGNFFLGSGYIGSTPQYYYYVKDSRGGYSVVNSSVYNTVIFESNDKQPVVSWQKIYYSINRLLFPFNMVQPRNSQYDLIVPVGTIVKDFKGF